MYIFRDPERYRVSIEMADQKTCKRVFRYVHAQKGLVPVRLVPCVATAPFPCRLEVVLLRRLYPVFQKRLRKHARNAIVTILY